MKRVALLGDSITEYMPYIIDKEAKRGFNVPLITTKIPNSDIIFLYLWSFKYWCR